jgi:hypothetical protein
MTLDNWAYSILNTVNPKMMDDEEVNLRQVKEWIVTKRATFLRNKLNSQKQIDVNISQTIPVLEMKFEVSSLQGGKVFKSAETIPNIISLEYGAAIVRIGSVDLTEPSFKFFDDLKAVSFSGNGRFNKYSIFAYMHNHYIYIKTKDPLFLLTNAGLSMTAVFSDPTELSKFRTSDGKLVYSDSTVPFPMDREFKDYIDNAITQDRFAITEISNPDMVTDAKDNSDAR